MSSAESATNNAMSLKSWNASFLEAESSPESKGGKNAQARLVEKDGTLSLRHKQLVWGNPLHTENAVLLKWVSVFQLIIMVFFGSWLIFALLYWVMEYANGTLSSENHDEKRCVSGIVDFNSALLFSVETMSTIGYGSRALSPNCPFIIFLATFQSLFGILISGVLTGLIMAKFQMPGARKSFIWFSKEAVVLKRNKKLYLMVKVADQRDIKLRAVTTTAIMVSKVVTEEGEVIRNNISSLKFGIYKENNVLPHLWPVCVAHEIDRNSPLYNFNPDMSGGEDLEFELILWVTGTTSSGGLVKARTSYIPSEIVWGGQFSFDQVFRKNANHITVWGKSSSFDMVETEELPRYSASVLEREGIIE